MALNSVMASRREIWGWGLYDFANSPFATTIMAVIFNRYFVEVLAGDDGVTLSIFGRSVNVPGVTFFTFTLATAMLIVAVTAPVLGAIADSTGSKKKFLAFFCYMGAGATALLYFAHEGQYWRGAIFFVIAQIGFAAGAVRETESCRCLSRSTASQTQRDWLARSRSPTGRSPRRRDRPRRTPDWTKRSPVV